MESQDKQDLYNERLWAAVRSGMVEESRELLKHADPNFHHSSCYTEYESILEAALKLSENKRDPMIDMLVEHGADIHARDGNNETVLHRLAWQSPQFSATEKAIALGADVNAQNVIGWTPLHQASLCMDDSDYVQLLIDNGADPTILNDDQQTAYDVACEANNHEAMKVLQAIKQQDTFTRGLEDIIKRKEQEEEGQVQTKGRLM